MTWAAPRPVAGGISVKYDYQGVISEYDGDGEQWHITDTTRPHIEAWTRDSTLVYTVVRAFGALHDGPEPTGTRDSGDEDPHA